MRTLTLSLTLMAACAVPATACIANTHSATRQTPDAGQAECEAKGGRCEPPPFIQLFASGCDFHEKQTDDSCVLVGRPSDFQCCVPSEPTEPKRCEDSGGTCMFGGCSAPHFYANATCEDPQQACCGGADDADGAAPAPDDAGSGDGSTKGGG